MLPPRKHRLIAAMISAGCIALAAGLAVPAAAQTDDAVSGGEDESSLELTEVEDRISVTVRRIEEIGSTVPLTLRVIGDEQIDRAGVSDITDVARLTPGMTYDIGAFPNDTRPAVRGMQAERGRPSLAVMLDGLDLSGENLAISGGGAGVAPDLIDLERIEIVKGPQTVLYGRNAFAGAINYVSKAPSDVLEGQFTVEAAEYGGRRALGMLSGPIVDGLLTYRINAAYRERDGFYTNPVTGGPLDAEQFKGIAGSFRFTPSERWDVTARYQISSTDNSDAATAQLPANTRVPVPGGSFAAGPPGTPQQPCPADLSGQPPQVVQACTRGTFVGPVVADISDVQMGRNEETGELPQGLDLDQELFTLDALYETDFGNFRYNFGWIDNDSFVDTDGDFTSYPAPPGQVFSLSAWQLLDYSDERFDHNLFWTHSVDDFNFLFGVQRLTEKSRLVNASQFWMRNPESPFTGPPFFLRGQQVTDPFPVDITRNTRYTGVYGSLSWQFTDDLRLGLEARWNSDQIRYGISGWTRQDTSLSGLEPVCLPGIPQGAVFQGQPGPDVPPPGTVQACPQSDKLSYREWTPRVTLDWTLTDDTMLYANAARGFKPGGFNVNETIDFEGQGYRPEFLDAYEVGVKSRWQALNLTLDAAIFYNDYTDQQIGIQRNQESTGGTVVAVSGTTNAGSVEAKGFEVAADWAPLDRVTLSLAYTYTDATFKNYVQGPPSADADPEDFAACGVPPGQVSTPQFLAEAGNACADFSGNRVAKNPKHAFNFGALYRAPFGGNGNTWFVEFNSQYRSKRYVDEANLSWMPSYTNLDVRAGVDFDRFSVVGFINNLTDDDTIRSAQRNIDAGNPEGFAPGRAIIGYLPEPRVAGVRVIYRFSYR